MLGYIDLSKRRVSPEDIVKCEERFNKGKMVASIMRHVAEKTKTPMETLYSEIGWPLNKKYGHAVDAFKLSITYGHYQPCLIASTNNLQESRCLARSKFPERGCEERASVIHWKTSHPSTNKSPSGRRSYLFWLRRYRRCEECAPRRRSTKYSRNAG